MGGFQVNLRHKISNIAYFCKFLLENLQILPDFVGFTVGPGGSSFGGGNPPIDSKVSDFKVGDLPPTTGVVSTGLGG